MSRCDENHDALSTATDASVWPSAARFMPAPATATQKAAMAANQFQGSIRSQRTQKTRLAFGTAAIVVAVAVPNLSLGAMVGSFGAPYLGGPEPFPETSSGALTEATNSAPATKDASDIWSPAQQPAGPVIEEIYAGAITAQERAMAFSSRTRLSDFDREMPVAVLAAGSQEFDLAFAGVEMPTTFVAPPSVGRLEGPAPLFNVRRDTIRTPIIGIDQITDMSLVVRATPEDAGEQGTTLAASSGSARTDAISNRSVEAAFAGAIDASNAVRSALPIATRTAPSQPASQPTSQPTTQRAIAVGAPPPELRGAAAAETALVAKTKMDARVNGVLTGSVDFQQGQGTIAIRLRSVANVMREQFSGAQYDKILGGLSIDSFVSLAELQAAGIPISYNPAYDEVEFGIDYQDAPNAKKVQIDQISVTPIGSQLTAIEQIPR